ncbi:MAG TPA: sialidase family protein, partial [Candidatus Thermoplasmatota archaeon]|nr:sialidase family protein [Candidatus Thermoplasmatota archaeon]
GVGGVGVAREFHDKQWFAIAPDGTALLVWNVNHQLSGRCDDPASVNECTQVLFSVTKDGGRTWSAPGVIAEGGIFSGAFPLIRADGGWVVSFRDTDASQIRVAVSTDQGATWTVSEAIDFTTKFPVLAATPGPAGERLHMAYPMVEGGHDSQQTVTLRWSDDGGRTWSAPLALDTPEAEGRTNPAIAPAANGSVIVTFFHPRGAGADYRTVAVRDGHVSEPLVLGTHEGTEGERTRHTGDYMGIAPLPDGSAFAVWNAKQGEAFTVTGARLVAE